MNFQESETVELKSIVVDDIKKEIIAFANCEGGILYIGVQDDGTVLGVDDPDETAYGSATWFGMLRSNRISACFCIMKRLM